jgi:hypothetical protein
MTTSFNGSSWGAYLNVREDGTIALRLPPVAGYCPRGKTVIFTFDSAGIAKAIKAVHQHQEYIKTPKGKAKLPPNFISNLIESKRT